jgi:hypothetical protein
MVGRMSVYHFTDTGRLPFIIRDGFLKPGKSTIGNFPDPDFLWATTQRVGDPSATCQATVGDKGYRDGLTRRVRFTLHADDFIPWRLAWRKGLWTLTQADALERSGLDMGSNPTHWLCRSELLMRERWLAVETKAWNESAWHSLCLDCSPVRDGDDNRLAMKIRGKTYRTERIEFGNGRVAYGVSVR